MFSITAERDQLQSSSTSDSTNLNELRQTHSSLQTSFEALQQQHTSLQSTYDTLQNTHRTILAENSEASSSRTKLDTDLSSTQGELSQVKAQLEEIRSKLDTGSKRAESAEKKRAALQEENAELVKQLEEARGRIVQVLDEKVDLASRIEELERPGAVKAREAVQQLETGGPPQDQSISSLHASHTLELSRHAEQIRHLEASLHASTSRVHSLSRELFETQKERDELVLSSKPSEPKFVGIDAILPANVRQKRQVSLAALKARMEQSASSSGKLQSVAEERGSASHTSGLGSVRKQFGDEIVFCCPACQGDLITV